MRAEPSLTALALQFALLSLLAVGGANAILPELHRQAVDVAGWMTERQFAEMFAIAQVTPGPNVIIVTLIGYHVAGLAGALVVTAAMCGPTCLFAYLVGHVWQRFAHAPWRMAIQAALVPISIGLLAASALVLAIAVDRNWVALTITATTAAVAYGTRFNPLWMFGGAAVIGLLGWV
jgi:chromate transporter